MEENLALLPRATLVEEAAKRGPRSDRKQGIFHVTTDSLEALRLYRKAISFRGPIPPSELLKRAVEIDPSFASAHIYLAHGLRNHEKAPEEYLPPARRAVEVAEAVSDRERFFILGSYYHLQTFDARPVDREKEFREAVRYYTSLLAIAPEHFWGTENLVHCKQQLGETGRIPFLWAGRADALPGDLQAQVTASRSFLFMHGSLAGARRYNQRALEALLPGPYRGSELHALAFAPLERWMEANPAGVLQQLDLLKQLLIETESRANFWGWHSLAMRLHLALGKLEEAERHEQLLQEAYRSRGQAGPQEEVMIAFFRGDSILRETLEAFRSEMGRNFKWSGFAAMLCVREGILEEHEAEMKRPPDTQLVRGELAVRKGEWAEAVPLLEAGTRAFLEMDGPLAPQYFLGVESLARALEADDDLVGAVEVLEEATEYRQRIRAAFSNHSHGFWMRNRLQLARLYRQAGRDDLAAEIEDELRELLAFADPDHTILLEL